MFTSRKFELAGVAFILILFPNTVHPQQMCESDRRGLIPGDITLGFLFPFYSASSDGFTCGSTIADFQNIQLLEAAIHTINNDATSTTNGVKIGLEAWDSCSSRQEAVERTMAYLGDRTPTMQTATQQCESVAFKPIVIGSLINDEGPGVASLLTDARVPLISYAATQSRLTSDNEYAFFSRNIPSDNDIARALVAILKRMGWTYVAMVTTDSSGEIAAGQTFQDIAESNGICVAVQSTVSEGTATVGFDQVLGEITAKPNARAVVLFTSSGLAQGVYAAANRANAELQWVLGHRALLDQSSLDQQPMITRGLLGVLPESYVPMTTLNSPFDGYFTGLSPDNIDTTLDPWFPEFYQELLGCNIGSASGGRPQCGPPQAQQFATNYVRTPYYEGVKQAVEVAMSAVRSMQSTKCPGMMGVCGPLLASTPQEWLEAVRTATVATQQAFRPDGSAANNRLNIYNMKMDGVGYSLQNVGSWQDGALTFDPANVDSWTGALNVPVMSECGVPCLDDACSAITTNTTMAYVGGDIILGGLFSMHTWDEASQSCGQIRQEGVLYLEAMLYALDQINSDSSILPAISLGIDGFDTCSSPRVAGEAAQQFVTEASFGLSGSGRRVTPNGMEELVYGVIGPENDDEVIVVNRILSFYGIPMIAYNSYDSQLSNSRTAPNLARMTPTSYSDTIPLARALGERGVRYVQMLYTSAYSSARSVFESIGRQNALCVARSISISSSTEWNDVFNQLAARSDARFVVLLTEPEIIQTFVSELQSRNLVGQYYLVGNTLFPLDALLQNDVDAVRGLTRVGRRDRTYTSEFLSYMTSLRPETNSRNPWFAEFWMDNFQCRLNGYQSSFTTPCTGNEALTSGDLLDSTIADVYDATFTMARALHDLQVSKCSSSTQLCADMIASEGSELFQFITRQFYPSSLDQEQIRFNSIGDVVTNFYIYNYQGTGPTLTPVPIATYISYGFSNTDATLVVYNETGNAVANITTQCTGLCDECNRIEKGQTAYIQGDIFIGGFFGISEPGEDQFTCTQRIDTYSIQLLEAFLFAVDMVNNDNTILPNMRLGAVGFDTCGSADKARREVANYVGGTVEYRTGFFPTKASVAGIIGGQTSDTSVAIADVLNSLMVNQVSYGASTTELSDDEEYPYFLRTLPSDTELAKAMIDLISRYNWDYVSIIFSENAYGRDIHEQFRKYAQDRGVCIAMALGVSAEGVVDYDRIVSMLVSNPQSKVVVMLTSSAHTQGVLEAAETAEAFDLQWIGGDTWGNRDSITSGAPRASRGALIIDLQETIVPGFETFFTQHTSYSNNRNPWWQDYIMDTFQCQIAGRPLRFDSPCSFGFFNFTNIYTQAPEVSYIVNAVMAFAVGVDQAIRSLCPDLMEYEICEDIYSNPMILHEHIRTVSFLGPDGTQFMFNEQGDGRPRYDIININQDLNYIKVGKWTSGNLEISGNVQFYNDLTVVSTPLSTCRGRCAECSQGSTTQPTAIQRGGELQFAALFAAHDQPQDISTDCGELREQGVLDSEALLYAIDLINDDNTILPGVTLGTMALDSCQSLSRGVRELSSVLSGARMEDDRQWFQIAAVLAGGGPDMISNAARVSQEYQYTQLSYSSVPNPSPSLISTTPSNNDKATALTNILMHYSWTYIATVYDGQDMQQRALLNRFLGTSYDADICVGVSMSLTENNQGSVLQQIEDDANINVVVVFANAAQAKALVEASNTRGGRRLTFTLAFPQEYPSSDVSEAFVGSLALFSPAPPVFFQNYVTSLNAFTEGISPWFVEFVEDKYSCSADSNASNPCQESDRATAQDVLNYGSASADIIDSVRAVAQGLHSLLRELCGEGYNGLCGSFIEATANPQSLQDAIANVTFTGVDGQLISLTNGARAGRFDVWNGQQMNAASNFAQVGRWDRIGLMLETGSVQLFDSASNPGVVQSACPAGSSCQASCGAQPNTLPPITRPPPITGQPPVTDRPTTTPPGPGNFVPFSLLGEIQFYILVAIAAVGIAITAVMIVIVIARWSNPSARGISSFLHLTLLLGILLLFILVPINFSPVSAPVCALQRIFAGLGYAFAYISVFLLVTRLYRIGIRERRITGKRPSYINNLSQAMIFSVFILIEVVFLVQWMAQQAPGDFIHSTVEGVTTRYCGHTSKDTVLSLLYVYLMMLLSLVISVQAWCSIKVIYSREFAVFIATILICLCIMVAWIIAAVLVDITLSGMASSINAIVQAFLLLAILVLPKAKLLCTGKHDEFWESASVTSNEYGGNAQHSRAGDFEGIENYPTEGENAYEAPNDHAHGNPAFENTLPDKSMDLARL